MTELWTPVRIEQRLTAIITELTNAQSKLARLRDAEVEAKHEHEAAKRRALLGEQCPKVTRGGVTTAERDGWVEEQVADHRKAYDLAVSRREAAADHLRVTRDQADIVRSLGTSVRQSYEISGSS